MTDWSLSTQADLDLRDLYFYGAATFGRLSAIEYVDGLTDCFDKLAPHPRMGRSATTAGASIRRFEHRRHVIYYEERGEAIFIIAIVHERSVRRIRN